MGHHRGGEAQSVPDEQDRAAAAADASGASTGSANLGRDRTVLALVTRGGRCLLGGAERARTSRRVAALPVRSSRRTERTSLRSRAGRHTLSLSGSQTWTPESEAIPARREAYPWPTARNFQSGPCGAARRRPSRSRSTRPPTGRTRRVRRQGGAHHQSEADHDSGRHGAPSLSQTLPKQWPRLWSVCPFGGHSCVTNYPWGDTAWRSQA